MVKTTVMAEATGHTFWPGPASHGRFLPVSAALGLCICCPCASMHHPLPATPSFQGSPLLRGSQTTPRWHRARGTNHAPARVSGLPQRETVKI